MQGERSFHQLSSFPIALQGVTEPSPRPCIQLNGVVRNSKFRRKYQRTRNQHQGNFGIVNMLLQYPYLGMKKFTQARIPKDPKNRITALPVNLP
jgi:hypothetical protein